MPRGSRRRSGSRSPKRRRGSRAARKSPRRSRSPKRSPRRFRGVENETVYRASYDKRKVFRRRLDDLFGDSNVKAAIADNNSIILDLLVFHSCIPVEEYKDMSKFIEMKEVNGKRTFVKVNDPQNPLEFEDIDMAKLSGPAQLLIELVDSFTVSPDNEKATVGLKLLKKFYARLVLGIGKHSMGNTPLIKIVVDLLVNNVDSDKQTTLLPVMISRTVNALDTMYLMASDKKQGMGIGNNSVREDLRQIRDHVTKKTLKFIEKADEDPKGSMKEFVEFIQDKKSIHNAIMFLTFEGRQAVKDAILSMKRFQPMEFKKELLDILPESDRKKYRMMDSDIPMGIDVPVAAVVKTVSDTIDEDNVQPPAAPVLPGVEEPTPSEVRAA